MLAPDPRQAGESVGARHAEVEEHDVGVGATDQRKDLRAGGALSDDLEVAGLFERSPHAFDDQPMVVGDENPHDPIVARRPAPNPLGER